MIPILFEPSDTVFNSNGIGRLSDAISCKVKEARNGAFELNMVYPLNGVHFKDLVKSGIIYGRPSARRGNQAFTIEKISRPINGRVSILARHIRNRMGLIPVSPFSAGSLSAALAAFKTNAAEACPFTLSADFESSSSYAVPIPTAMLSYLGGQRGSILDVYGGEWEFDNWSAILHRNRGQDNGYRIIYGKNLVDLKQEESILNTYTGIYPYWQSEETMVTLPEKVVHSAAAANWPYQRTVVKDFTEAFVNAPTVAQLRSYTESFIQRNDVGKPSVSLSVKWVNAQDTPEYKALLQSNVDLCDTVEVYFSALGVNTTAKIIEYEWDMLQERYESLEIGDRRETLALTIEEQLKTISTLPTADQMHTAIDRATGVLNSGTRGHMIANRNPEGWANELLFLDNENIAAARQVLRINMAGIGFSDSGYTGPFSQSWDLLGHLTLGGVNNSYGDFTILDENAVPVLQMDKKGFALWNISAKGYLNNGTMYTDSDLTTPITPTEGYYYYDVVGRAVYLWNGSAYEAQTGTGGIYARMTREDGLGVYHGVIDFSWGANAVGFYADGTRVQMGDWIINNASYGRYIFQSIDEVTGMSAETDDPAQLYAWAGDHGDSDYVLRVNGSGIFTLYDVNIQGTSVLAAINEIRQKVSASTSEGDDDEEESYTPPSPSDPTIDHGDWVELADDAVRGLRAAKSRATTITKTYELLNINGVKGWIRDSWARRKIADIQAYPTYFGTCDTAAATADKVVTCPGFTLATGARITVLFTYGQGYNATPSAPATLNVNNTGAVSIYRIKTTRLPQYYWSAGQAVDFVYDGTNFVMVGGGLATMTEYGITKLTSSLTSTSTYMALTASAGKSLQDQINALSARITALGG